MATISDQRIGDIRRRYQTGKSARVIAKELRVSIDAVYYFLRKHRIPRRSPRENNALQFQRKDLSFHIKHLLSDEDERLRIAGIMLYWGEGSQWFGETNVDFANSKPAMVKVFVDFLHHVCRVDEKRLRVYLYCYAYQQPQILIRFWSALTGISTKQFTKPYIRKDFRSEKVGRMEHGLVHIRYSDKKLLEQIKNWIEEFAMTRR